MGSGAGYAGGGACTDSMSRDGMGSGRVIRDGRRCCGGVRGAALSKKSAHGGAAQQAASGSSGRHQEVTGGNWRLWALFQCVSPRMGVCEPLSTVHGLCQSRRAVSITQAWQLSLFCSPMGVPVRTHTRGWVHSDGDSLLL